MVAGLQTPLSHKITFIKILIKSNSQAKLDILDNKN